MSTTPGSATSTVNNSVQSFVTALVINSGALALEVAAFTYLHRKYTRIYSPRSFLPHPSKRSTALPLGFFRWIPAVIKAPAKEMIHKNGLDAYMLVRFLKILIMIFIPFTILTFAVIIPVDSVGLGGSDLGRFSSGNIPNTQQTRYAAHVVVAYTLTGYVIWLLRREMLRFVHLRHQFLISKSHSKLAQAKTVLITSLPEKDLVTEADLRAFASFVPGGVAKIWVYRDAPGLNDYYQQRLDACDKLETAISKLLRDATKAWAKKQKKDKSAHKSIQNLPEMRESEFGRANGKGNSNGVAPPNTIYVHDTANRPVSDEANGGHVDIEARKSSSPLSILDSVSRPTRRLGFHRIPWSGKKVDTIEWAKKEIPRLNDKIAQARMELPNAKPHGAAMIMCNFQMGAHVLAQCTSYHEPLKMVDKWIELSPEDVVWNNIDDTAIETRGRWIISWLATLGLIVLWSFPVAFTGTLSNIDQLCGELHWLRWVCTMPKPLPGIVQGVLPPLFLSILFLLLPFVLKAFAYFECIPRYSLISISVYRRYFLFLVIHGFLVVTLSSGLTSAIPSILNDPRRLLDGLAHNLPSASVFYLTYMIANGFTAAGFALLQLLPLFLLFVKRLLFGNTPRQAYNVEFIMPNTDLGTTLPRLSLLATIGIAYSVIAPIVAAFAAIAFSFLWFAWKFLMMWVMDQPEAQETGGLYFPLAVSNLFVGLYVEQLALAALFFLATDADNHRSSIPEACLMLVLVVITAIAQITIRNAFRPITNYLPMSLATKDMLKRYKTRENAAAATAPRFALPATIGNVGGAALHQVEETFDLFNASNVRSMVRRRFRTTKRPPHHPAPEDEQESEGVNEPVTPVSPGAGTVGGSTVVDSPVQPPEDIPRDRASMKSDDDDAQGRPPSRASSHPTSDGADAVRRSSLHITPPAKTLRDDDSDDDVDEDMDEHAFDHPSTYKPAPWIWVPKDPLGLSDVLLEELREAGVDASDLGASMNEKARVRVKRGPPDRDWIGGNDV